METYVQAFTNRFRKRFVFNLLKCISWLFMVFFKGEHNEAYDHEAFLGDEAEQFASLTPEEARVKLGLVVDKIDQDNDTLVTEAELTRWIKETAQRSVDRRTEEFWTRNNPGGEKEISWDKYRAIQYGFLTDSHITNEGGRWIFYLDTLSWLVKFDIWFKYVIFDIFANGQI